MVWRGTYAGGTAYVPDDVVEYTDTAITSTYICTTASTGNAPSSGGTAHGSWAYMAKGAQGTPTTTRGDIIYRGASADERLAKGAAGKVLTMGASEPEWGTGFAGTHYLAYSNRHAHNTETSVNGNGLSNGSADGERDCILINDGNYHTVTPAHVDDIIIMYVQTNIYSNWNNNGSYWGLGFMHSTATNFSANRYFIQRTGQHSWGNGQASNGDHYQTCSITEQFDVSDVSMNVGTTYYLRAHGQVHSPNKTVEFNNGSGTQSGGNFVSWLRHYKRNV